MNKNPRESFGAIVLGRLAVLNLSQTELAGRMAKRLGITTKYSGYINSVIHGRKTPPIEDREKWASVLRITGAEERRAFFDAHDAALAWGKADGRGHVERLEKLNRALASRVEAQEATIRSLKAKLAQLAAGPVLGE
jgi:hypothetical protein